MTYALERFAFKTSRLAEFCGQKELTAQTGHAPDEWPLVIAKELVDNGLDICEEAGIAPAIGIGVWTERCEIMVADNGPGLSSDTLKDILDYHSRTSSREAYVSPSRGQQGNALQTIFAMAFALDEVRGETVIESKGQLHRIIFETNPVRREPRILRELASSDVQIGTRITVKWPSKACLLLEDARERFVQIAGGFATFNPHITLQARWDDEVIGDLFASDDAWNKWRTSDPTPAHWYTTEQFGRYIAAHLARDEDHGITGRTVRDFISELRGLSRSGKQKLVLAETATSGVALSAFFAGGRPAIAALLNSCKRHTRPVKPGDLGMIGADRLLEVCLALDAAADSFTYRKHFGTTEAGLPYAIEAAFAYLPGAAAARQIITGVNFSAAIDNPFARLGYHQSLTGILEGQYIGANDPVVVVLHYASPVPEFSDRGKSSVTLPYEVRRDVTNLVKLITEPWAKQRRAEVRDSNAAVNRQARLLKQMRRPEKKPPLKPVGVLAEKLLSEIAAAGLSLKTRKDFDALAVLSPGSDPYLAWRQRPAAEWFAGLFNRFKPTGEIHLRGFFYLLVSSPDRIAAASGKPFVNDYRNWSAVQKAGNAARWLGLVPFNRITDERNDEPVIYVPDVTTISTAVSPGKECDIASTVDEALPSLRLDGFIGRQTHRMIFWGEKSSLDAVVRPIAKQTGAEMILGTGEASARRVFDAVSRAFADGRPAVIFYLSDFDPSGYQMPISVARKLQAFKDLLYPDLDVQLHQVALTIDQIRALGLPSSPLKATEKRASKWRQIWGHEQTEIDAMVVLHHEALREAIFEAIKPFYDTGLEERVSTAEAEWQAKADEAMRSHPDYEDASERIVDAWQRVSAAAEELHSEQERAARLLEDSVPEQPKLPEAEPEGEAMQPLFDSKADFMTATLELIRRKALTGSKKGSDDEE